jgi:nucleotidyltransferase/DNA polymerase involved in DNA repair
MVAPDWWMLGKAADILIGEPLVIRAETGLTASAGVSYKKFLAKLASDQRKPDGLFVITPKMGPAFVENLPVGKFHGVGPATTAKMNRLGIETGLDLRAQTLPFLQEHFGKSGPDFVTAQEGQWRGSSGTAGSDQDLGVLEERLDDVPMVLFGG